MNEYEEHIAGSNENILNPPTTTCSHYHVHQPINNREGVADFDLRAGGIKMEISGSEEASNFDQVNPIDLKDTGLPKVSQPSPYKSKNGNEDTSQLASHTTIPSCPLSSQCRMLTGLDQFFGDGNSTASQAEIDQILADFNEILNSGDPYAFSDLETTEELIGSTVEEFSELLIGGNEDTSTDLLILLDDEEDESSYTNTNQSHVTSSGEEGYDSDLPLVRKSMRRLQPLSLDSLVLNQTNPSTSSITTDESSIIPQINSGSLSHTQQSPIQLTSDLNPVIEVPEEIITTPRRTQVMEIESSSPRREYRSTGIIRSSPLQFPTRSTDCNGCSSFRPSTDLVFTNLHIPPPDLTEALTTDSGTLPNGGDRPIPNDGTSTTSRPPTISPPTTATARGNRWPHRLSSVLALIGCTLGLTNICRFGSLSIQYGANFTLQFTILSILFGIPLLLFHMSIGQYLGTGIVNMWKISPIFRGIGIGLLVSQAMIGIYTAVGVGWMFTYFRDSFIPRYDQYRWGKCFREYRGCDMNPFNTSHVSETVPDYFNGVVLQRSSVEFPTSSDLSSGLKFTVAFNLAVVWMLVFVSLSKGLKSYGKVIHGLILVPITALLVLSSKMVALVPSEDAGFLFGQTSWEDFFFNTQTWIIASREVFFTWALFGACVMQITAHNRPLHSLKSDAIVIVLVTTFVLLLAAFLANACYYIILVHGYDYISSSFECAHSYKFLVRKQMDTAPTPYPSPPTDHYTSFLMGIRITPSGGDLGDIVMDGTEKATNGGGHVFSGYQALRLATELFPTTMAFLGSQGLSPFWTVLFYFTCILFGLGQQLAIWYAVVKGVISIKQETLKSWETCISLCVCTFGFLMGLPLSTEFGIYIVYFLDYTIGSGWWIMILYLLELVAVFIVRGSPYCGENIVTILYHPSRGRLSAILAPALSFIWNVILPVAILILSISSFRTGHVRELYDWAASGGYLFWPSWTRELGSLIQLVPLLIVPFVAIIQTLRYLSNGPSDLFDRIQLLYRPPSLIHGLPQNGGHGTGPNSNLSPSRSNSTSGLHIDPPPKYTPPPSYSAVSGAKIAKFLRNSIRRSIRRISNNGPGSSGPGSSNGQVESLPPPPTYTSVLVEMNGGAKGGNGLIPVLINPTSLAQDSPPGGSSSSSHRIYSIDSNPIGRRQFEINITQGTGSRSSTLGRENDKGFLDIPGGIEDGLGGKLSLRRIASDITPHEVARILRASFRRDKIPSSSIDSYHSPISLSYSNPPHLTMHPDEALDTLSIINQETVRGSQLNYNSNFDWTSRQCRSRRSNDSQLGLLANQHPISSDLSLGNQQIPSGLINSSFGSNEELSGVNRDKTQFNHASNTLSVPGSSSTSIQSSSTAHPNIPGRPHHHRTN